MNRDDSDSDHGGRVERSTRLAGVLLLVAAVLTNYLTDRMFNRGYVGVVHFETYRLAAQVLAPAGAVLITTSLAIRALIRPYSSPSARAQLVVGLILLAVGVLQVFLGGDILAAISDFLGATANAGVLLAELLARVIGLTALPLGVALLATQPLIRLAQTRWAHSLSAGPPDVESLD